MIDKPKVSTITACYKKSTYLETFLEELPNQTYFSHLEIVFDHNEPINEEIELIKKFQNKYPNHLKHLITNPVEPLGVSWNRCIRESCGEYLTIWNIDDLRTPQSIEKQATFLTENPDIDIVIGNLFIVSSFPSKEGKYINNSKYRQEGVTARMVRFGPFFMFRKSLCEKAGYFDEQFRCANDFDFMMRLLFHGKAYILNENLGYFLNEGKGASTKPDSFCNIESTVINLRYGLYDRIDYQYLPKALKYNVYNIKVGNHYIPVGEFIPNYDALIENRFNEKFTQSFFKQLITYAYNKIKKLIKRIFRRFGWI